MANIDIDFLNTRRHYFDYPSYNYSKQMNKTIFNTHVKLIGNDDRVKDQDKNAELNFADKNIEMVNQSERANNRFNLKNTEKYTNFDISGIMNKIKLVSENAKINPIQVIYDFFENKSFISFRELKKFLSNVFHLSENENNRLLGQIMLMPPNVEKREETCNKTNPNNFIEEITQNDFDNFQNSNPEVIINHIIEFLTRNSSQSKSKQKNLNLTEPNHYKNPFENIKHNGSNDKKLIINSRYENNEVFHSNKYFKRKTDIKSIINHIKDIVSKQKINLFQFISEFDYIGNGRIERSSLENALNKLKVYLNYEDLSRLLIYAGQTDFSNIAIKDFLVSLI